VIARVWKGQVRSDDRDAYADYMQNTGVAGYASTPGNRGVYMLQRDLGENTEFVMFTLWDSIDAVKAFAGPDHETAVFYPEDDRYLVERELTASHYRVVTAVVPS
jgi:heme-degrading monooxygenase HmoA